MPACMATGQHAPPACHFPADVASSLQSPDSSAHSGGSPAPWRRKRAILQQITALEVELDDIAENIAAQVVASCVTSRSLQTLTKGK